MSTLVEFISTMNFLDQYKYHALQNISFDTIKVKIKECCIKLVVTALEQNLALQQITLRGEIFCGRNFCDLLPLKCYILRKKFLRLRAFS